MIYVLSDIIYYGCISILIKTICKRQKYHIYVVLYGKNGVCPSIVTRITYFQAELENVSQNVQKASTYLKVYFFVKKNINIMCIQTNKLNNVFVLIKFIKCALCQMWNIQCEIKIVKLKELILFSAKATFSNSS